VAKVFENLKSFSLLIQSTHYAIKKKTFEKLPYVGEAQKFIRN